MTNILEPMKKYEKLKMSVYELNTSRATSNNLAGRGLGSLGPYPIHAADGYYTRDSSCIVLLMVTPQLQCLQATTKGKLVGYQKPALSLCQDEICVWNYFASTRIVFTFVQLFSSVGPA